MLYGLDAVDAVPPDAVIVTPVVSFDRDIPEPAVMASPLSSATLFARNCKVDAELFVPWPNCIDEVEVAFAPVPMATAFAPLAIVCTDPCDPIAIVPALVLAIEEAPIAIALVELASAGDDASLPIAIASVPEAVAPYVAVAFVPDSVPFVSFSVSNSLMAACTVVAEINPAGVFEIAVAG